MLERTQWKCAAGHTFTARGANIWMGIREGGRGCPYCSHRWRRRGVDYHTLAKKHGIEWLGRAVPGNTRQATTWKLPDGTEFAMSYRSIAARGSRIADFGLRRQAQVPPDAGAE